MPEIVDRDVPFMGCLLRPRHPCPSHGRARRQGPLRRAHRRCRLHGDRGGRARPFACRACPRSSARWSATRRRWRCCPRGVTHLVSSAPCPVQMVRTGQKRLRHPVPSRGQWRDLRHPHPHLQGPWLFRPRRRNGADRGRAGRGDHCARTDSRPLRRALRVKFPSWADTGPMPDKFLKLHVNLIRSKRR